MCIRDSLYTAPAAVPSGAVTVRATDTASGVNDTAAVTVTQTPPAVTVDVTPATASVQTGATQQFTATVTGSSATPVWSVNGITGGNSTIGTISASGLYTAPAGVPSGAVIVVATDAASGADDTASVTVTQAPPPVTVAVAPTSASVATGATRQFTATVTGSSATPVWSVNNVTGGNSTVGTISASGLYTAPAAVPAGAVTVRATDTASGVAGSASVTVTTSGGPAPRNPNLLPLVDTFTGADIGPPPGPAWASGPIWSGQPGWKRLSNTAGPSTTGWTDAHLTATSARPVGIRFQVTTPPASGSVLFTWLVSGGMGSNPSGYALRLQRGSTDAIQIQRWSNGSATFLKGTSITPIAAGSWLALMVDATTVEAFRSSDGTNWVSLGSVADTTYTGQLAGGVETNGSTTRIDNVGYGPPTTG